MQVLRLPWYFAALKFSNPSFTCAYQPDSDFWNIETPPPTPGEVEEEEDEVKESESETEEGELDSVGLLFHSLFEKDIPIELCSRFISSYCNPETGDAPTTRTSSPAHSPPREIRKKSYNVIAKVSITRFRSDPRYRAHREFLMQDPARLATPQVITRETSHAAPNAAGIPINSNLSEPLLKTLSVTRPLAGQIRTPKSHSLTASSSANTSSSGGFQINAG